jgi:membrane protease YdiL (CAAX protease family)
VIGVGERLSLYSSTIAFQWIIAGIVLWRAFSRGLSRIDLGLTVSNPWSTAGIAIIFTTLLCANQFASLRRVAQLVPGERGSVFSLAERIMPRTNTEMIVFVALACTAGVSEEFLYRGFLFAVFARLFTGPTLSILIAAVTSSALFGIGHLYQGKRGIITTFVVGMLFSAVRIWSGSLVPAMVAHAAVDLIAGLCVAKFVGVA